MLASLEARRQHPELFRAGGYQPLRASGAHAAHVVAFARRHADQTLVVVAGRLFAQLMQQPDRLPLGDEVWGDTCVECPFPGARTLTHVLTGENVEAADGWIRVSRALGSFPAAALLG